MTATQRQWTFYHSVGILFSVLYSLTQRDPTIFLLFAIASFLIFIWLEYPTVNHFRPLGGWANLITLLRLALVITTIPAIGLIDTIYLLIMLIAVLVLDGLDGYVARKSKTTSSTGAKFDMEVDALFVVVLTLTLVSKELVPSWTIALGLIRYLYALALNLMGIEEKKEPVSYFKKTVAIALIAVLILLLVFSSGWMVYLLYAVAILLLSSFLHSFIFQVSGKWIPII